MRTIKKATLIILLSWISNVSYSQTSLFQNPMEVAEFLEGRWRIDQVKTESSQIPIGQFPTQFLEFENISTSDSIILSYRSYINVDSLVDEVIVTIQEISAQDELPKWQIVSSSDSNQLYSLLESVGFFESNENQTTLKETNSSDELGITRVESVSTENLLEDYINIYPNPSSESINIKIEIGEFNGKINLLNSLGQSVFVQSVRNTDEISILNLPSGNYYMHYISWDTPEKYFLIKKITIIK